MADHERRIRCRADDRECHRSNSCSSQTRDPSWNVHRDTELTCQSTLLLDFYWQQYTAVILNMHYVSLPSTVKIIRARTALQMLLLHANHKQLTIPRTVCTDIYQAGINPSEWVEFNYVPPDTIRSFRRRIHPGSLVHLLFSSGWPAT